MNEILECVRKTTETSLAGKQELIRKWTGLWLGVPTFVFPVAEVQKYQQRCVEVAGELLQKQSDTLAVPFKMGFDTIEKLCQFAAIKEPEQLGAQTMELWRKTLDNLSLISIAQIRGFQSAVSRWAALMDKEPPHGESVAPRTKPKADEGRKVLGMSPSEREELKEAFREYEMSKGDWAMDR